MSEERQQIFHHKVSVHWRKKIGNGYSNHYRGNKTRPYEFVSRAKTLEDMNSNPELMFQMMNHMGIANTKVYDFHVIEIYESKPLGDSFYYNESDYDKEFK